MPIKLNEIIEALDMQSDESRAYFNRNTSAVIRVTDEELRIAEDDEPLDDYPQWQWDSIKAAKEIISDRGNYLSLPSKFDIHEYSIMERFCLSLKDEKLSDSLCKIIKGKGAFRRFKQAINEYGIVDDWYKYRDAALRQISISWCEENNIKWLE